MKRNYIFAVSLVLVVGLLSLQKTSTVRTSGYTKSHKFTSGSTTGRTGAPGEGNCTSCHAGTVMSGSSENQFAMTDGASIVTTYVPGTTYQIALTMASNPIKKGMQVTARDNNDATAGTFSAGIGVAFTTVTGKSYANHTAISSGATFPGWSWSWTAPASNVGPVRFYVATNAANNNNQNTGDVIHLSNHTYNATVSLNEKTIETVQDFTASFSAENAMIYVQFSSLINGVNFVNLVDMNGKSVLNMNMGTSTIGINKESIRLPEHIKNGQYVVQFFVDNNPMSKMISVMR